MAYTYEQVFAADPSNPSNVAQNASITIFAPGDTSMTPLTITDPDGQPLANPIPVNANGFGSAFAHATLDRVAWAGGGFTGFFTSYEGMKQVAVDAKDAAEAIAALAAAGEFTGPQGPQGAPGQDGANVLPTDEAVSFAITTPGSETETALKEAFIPGNPTLSVTYNADGSVATTTEDGVLTTFTYNTDGTVNTQTRAGITKTFTYDAAGNVTGAA